MTALIRRKRWSRSTAAGVVATRPVPEPTARAQRDSLLSRVMLTWMAAKLHPSAREQRADHEQSGVDAAERRRRSTTSATLRGSRAEIYRLLRMAPVHAPGTRHQSSASFWLSR